MEIETSSFLRRNFIEIILFSYFLLFLILIRLRVDIVVPTGHYNDYYCYIEMSKDISIIFEYKIIQPYCYRILVPLIVGFLPFDIAFNFALIGFISFYLTGIMLYYTLRIQFNKLFSVLGFFLFWSITLSKYEFLIEAFFLIYLVDLPGYLFLICSFFCIVKDYRKLYTFFLCIGILTKESAIFSIPVFILYNFYNQRQQYNFKLGLKKFLELCKYILPGITIFILLRIIAKPDLIANHSYWYAVYGENEYLTFGMIIAMVKHRLDDLIYYFGLFNYTLGFWEIMVLFILFNKRKDLIKWLKIYGIFIILVYSQIFLAFAKYRCILMAFYPITFLSVQGFENEFNKLINYSNNYQLKTEIKMDNTDFFNLGSL